MPTLLHISNLKDARAPKMLYVSDDTAAITAYIYINHNNYSLKEIRARFKKDLVPFDITQSVEFKKTGEILISEDGWLNHVAVSDRYQKMGIGTRLVQLAVNHLNLRRIPCVTENDDYEYSLSAAGEQLVLSCIKQGIITENMCFTDGCSHSPDDPGQISLAIAITLSRLASSETKSLKRKYSIDAKKPSLAIFNEKPFFFSPIRQFLTASKEPEHLFTAERSLSFDDFTDTENSLSPNEAHLENTSPRLS